MLCDICSLATSVRALYQLVAIFHKKNRYLLVSVLFCSLEAWDLNDSIQHPGGVLPASGQTSVMNPVVNSLCTGCRMHKYHLSTDIKYDMVHIAKTRVLHSTEVNHGKQKDFYICAETAA